MVRGGFVLSLILLTAGCVLKEDPTAIGPAPGERPWTVLDENLTLRVLLCPGATGCVRSEAQANTTGFFVPGDVEQPVQVTVRWVATAPTTEELRFRLLAGDAGGHEVAAEWVGESPLEENLMLPPGSDYVFSVTTAQPIGAAVEQDVNVRIEGRIYIR